MIRFTDFNRQFSSPSVTYVCALVVFFVAFSAYTLSLHGELNAPPEIGDAHDYDAIGLQLSRGNGFSINWDDPDFRASYLQNNQDGRYDELLNRHGGGLTTYRPPLFPILIAITYKLFGRKFWPTRVLNGLLIAFSCVFAFSMISSRFGVIPGLLCAGWLINDVQLQTYSRTIMTEAPAVFVVTLICWLLLRTVETRSWKASLGLGTMTGIAFLTRSVFVLWMPVIVIGVYFLSLRPNVVWHIGFLPTHTCLGFFSYSFDAMDGPQLHRAWRYRTSRFNGSNKSLGGI